MHSTQHKSFVHQNWWKKLSWQLCILHQMYSLVVRAHNHLVGGCRLKPPVGMLSVPCSGQPVTMWYWSQQPVKGITVVRLGKDIAQSKWLEMPTFKKVEMELLRVKQHTVMLGKATCCSFQSSACLSSASGSSDGEDTVNSRREACTQWVNVIKASGDTRQCSPLMMNVHQLNGQTKLCKIGLNCR